MDTAAIYEETRLRVTDLVGSAAADAAHRVPACPDWSVSDLIAHVSGLAADWRRGNLDRYGSPGWTDEQVQARRGRSLDELLDEWADHAAAIAPALADPEAAGLPSFMPMVVITDLAAHEHDLRGALARPGARDATAVEVGLRSQIGGMRQHFGRLGLPTLRVEAAGWRGWMIGRDEPAATVRADAFELFRASGGRRTVAEVRELEWHGDAEPFITNFLQPPFEWPTESLGE